MEQNRNEGGENKVGITNRGVEQEKPGQDYVMEATGVTDMDEYDRPTLTPDEESGGERQVDSKDGTSDHSHH